MDESIVGKVIRQFERPPPPAPFLSYADALRVIEADFRIVPESIDDVTLSGARMNEGGAYLDLNVPSGVDGDTGLIHFFGSGGPCGGEVLVYMPGARAGATYLGQLRCAITPYNGAQLSAVGVNIFGGAGGPSFGQVRADRRSLVVPFILTDPHSPAPYVPAGSPPYVAFHPIGLASWQVHDVRIRKV